MNRNLNYLNEQMIRYAIKHCNTIRACSNFLNISSQTFRKYARQFRDENGKSLLEVIQEKSKTRPQQRTKYHRSEEYFRKMLSGERVMNISKKRFEELILFHNILEYKCSVCGYDRARVFDFKKPLILEFLDGSSRNGHIDNIRFICFNCYFQEVGNISIRQHALMVDVDEIDLGALHDIEEDS